MKNDNSISVVIATLGGEFLEPTLSSLNEANLIPDEILICVPNSEIDKININLPFNARLVGTPARGQVAQRAYGLRQANGKYVLQLDDDVLLYRDGLELLLEAVEKAGRNSAVSPLFVDCKSGKYLTEYRTDFRGILRNIYAFLIGGSRWGAKRMGKIDRSGIPYAVDSRYCNRAELFTVNWLPGGCVITNKENLVFDNYFPLKGKAFSEDVIHSLIWRQRGVSLWIAPNITVRTYISSIKYSIPDIIADYRARKIVVSMINGSLWRCRLRLLISILRCLPLLLAKSLKK